VRVTLKQQQQQYNKNTSLGLGKDNHWLKHYIEKLPDLLMVQFTPVNPAAQVHL